MRIYEVPIAHRGLHGGDIPENSMAAYIKAMEMGYNIEIDVRFTLDKKVVIFHDGTTDRVTGTPGTVSKLTYEELKSERYRLPNGEVIPLLEDLLKLVDGKTNILCEIKSANIRNFELEAAVYELIKGKPWVIMQSFNPLSLVWFRKHAPEVLRGQLATYSSKRIIRFLFAIGNPFRLLHRTKPAFIAYDIRFIPSAQVECALKKYDMKLITWTVRTEEELKNALNNRVDNVIFEHIKPEGFEGR